MDITIDANGQKFTLARPRSESRASRARCVPDRILGLFGALAGNVTVATGFAVGTADLTSSPSRLETILRDPRNKGAVPFLVSAPDAASKAVRVNVTIPEAILPVRDLPVILRPGEDSFPVAERPLIPGCISQGRMREEALANILEAVTLELECRAAEGWSLPEGYEVATVTVAA